VVSGTAAHGTPLAEAPIMSPVRILVVDDEPAVRDALARALAGDGLEVHTASHAVEALEKADELAPDIVLSDVQMAGMSGVELLEALRVRHDDLPVLLMSSGVEETIDVCSLAALIALQLEVLRQRRRSPGHPSR
jgi:CheY-like chemotaxis protein